MITLNTILYEGNFREVLKPDSWFFKFNSNLITRKLLTINNIVSHDEFRTLIDELLKTYSFSIVYVDRLDEIVKDKFKLDINKNTTGYYYTIPYFVAIYSTSTEYLLNIASDCLKDINIDDEFLESAINELNTNPLACSTMVAWTKDNHIMSNNMLVAEYEELETLRKLNQNPVLSDNFHYTANFTDQFFLSKTDKLKKIDYNIDQKFSNMIYNGPSYGGNSFEKRMVAHQVYNKEYNCVFKGKQYYIHNNMYY